MQFTSQLVRRPEVHRRRVGRCDDHERCRSGRRPQSRRTPGCVKVTGCGRELRRERLDVGERVRRAGAAGVRDRHDDRTERQRRRRRERDRLLLTIVKPVPVRTVRADVHLSRPGEPAARSSSPCRPRTPGRSLGENDVIVGGAGGTKLMSIGNAFDMTVERGLPDDDVAVHAPPPGSRRRSWCRRADDATL